MKKTLAVLMAALLVAVCFATVGSAATTATLDTDYNVTTSSDLSMLFDGKTYVERNDPEAEDAWQNNGTAYAQGGMALFQNTKCTEKDVAASLVLTIDLGETFPEQGSLSAAFTVSYAVQVEGYSNPGDKPSNFQLLLCNDSAGTSPAAIAALPISGSAGNYSGSLTAALSGSRVYVRVQTDPWDAGYTLRNVVIGYTVTDRSHVVF